MLLTDKNKQMPTDNLTGGGHHVSEYL